MKKKLILALAAMGVGLATASYATPGDWEQRYCAENPRECYCEVIGHRKYCVIL